MDQRRAFHYRSPARALLYGRALCPLRHQPEDRLQVARALRRRGPARARERSHVPHTCPHRISARSRSCSAARAGRTRAGARSNSSHGSRPAPGRRLAGASAPPVTSSRGRASAAPAAPPAAGAPGRRAAVTSEPNDLWTVDFKGQFRTRDGVAATRLRSPTSTRASCSPARAAVDPRPRGAARPRAAVPRLRAAARDPQRQRRALRHPGSTGSPSSTSGGSGSASCTSGSCPAHPQENGCARANAQDAQGGGEPRRRKPSRRAQQRRFAAFRAEYNTERPHRRSAGQPPACQYHRPRAPTPRASPPLEYPGHFLVKRVTHAGTFRFKDRLLFIANALKQHHIGSGGDGRWRFGRSTSGPSSSPGSTSAIHDFPRLTPHRESVTHHPGLPCHPSSRLLTAMALKRLPGRSAEYVFQSRAFQSGHGSPSARKEGCHLRPATLHRGYATHCHDAHRPHDLRICVGDAEVVNILR